MITKSEITQYDKSGMFDVLAGFGKQVQEAFSIGKDLNPPAGLRGADKIIVTGLGGSAIGGDLLRSYLNYEIKVPVFINRNYYLPAFADENTLVIASSYSGNTEETISAYEDAKQKGCKIACVSSGGNLSVMAENDGNMVIKVPKGYQPRCALAYSFFPMLILLGKMEHIYERDSEILNLVDFLNHRSELYTAVNNEKNSAISLAGHLHGKIPIIYSSNDLLDIVNLRWRGQICENAKSLAFGNYLPEMNHNEIVGWQENSDFLRNFAVLYLKDREDNPAILKRLGITKQILEQYRGLDIEID
jgi:glucose/mannose-6-phosphate isomerase